MITSIYTCVSHTSIDPYCNRTQNQYSGAIYRSDPGLKSRGADVSSRRLHYPNTGTTATTTTTSTAAAGRYRSRSPSPTAREGVDKSVRFSRSSSPCHVYGGVGCDGGGGEITVATAAHARAGLSSAIDMDGHYRERQREFDLYRSRSPTLPAQRHQPTSLRGAGSTRLHSSSYIDNPSTLHYPSLHSPGGTPRRRSSSRPSSSRPRSRSRSCTREHSPCSPPSSILYDPSCELSPPRGFRGRRSSGSESEDNQGDIADNYFLNSRHVCIR